MSAFYSSPVSPSSDPGTYVSILRNIKRKAINAGARPQDFDAYLRQVLLVVNGSLYRGYTESDKTWHIDLYTWEHFFTEPFPFLADCDFHPNGNSTTIVVRNPSIVRPLDIIFTTSPRVPPPQVLAREPSNKFRGLHTQVGGYVPGLVFRDPPPKMGSLTGGGEGVGLPSVKTGGEEMNMNREVGGGREDMAAPVLPEAIGKETPSSVPSRHHRKRPRRCTN